MGFLLFVLMLIIVSPFQVTGEVKDSGISVQCLDLEFDEYHGDKPFRIVIWQKQLQTEDFLSLHAFREQAERGVERALSLNADCLIIPEYANVMLALLPFSDLLGEIQTVEEGLVRISQLRRGETSLPQLFREGEETARAVMDQVWGNFAKQYGITILSGTYFANGQNGLVNRALLYDSSGKVIYYQDKIHLTSFEEELIGLVPGDRTRARIFTLDGLKIGMSICRDTFFNDYAHLMEDADIWIDLKANGEEFVQETAKLFSMALQKRQEQYGIPLGITACLNGEFLNLHWEGPSSVTVAGEYLRTEGLKSKRYKVVTILESSSPDREEMLLISLK